ncbi:unnamed protein product [marine sediment metagenome]|uniref:Gamma-glutamyl phosphate reductase n=1 Tax=marine sediment metagenome TaxID=412755 RepID=X1LUQ1_9ZZZZ
MYCLCRQKEHLLFPAILSLFGLGAEIGISTQKLHARGPMGVCELTSSKFIILGDGQIRE